MKIKTSELIGAALDWAVAKCAGLKGVVEDGPVIREYYPSTDWSQGGPIIERELCELVRCQSGSTGPVYWEAHAGFEHESGHAIHYGPTPLIAAMRCYVASKLGDEVEIPGELT